MIKNNSKHIFIFPEIPARSTLSDIEPETEPCLVLSEVEPIYTVDPYQVLVWWLLIQSDLVSITYLQFFVFETFKAFFQN